MESIDFIGAIELAYDRAPEDDAWLQQLTRAIAPAFGLGAPTTSFFFQLDGERVTVGTSASVGDRTYSASDYQRLNDTGGTAVKVSPRSAYECDVFALLSRIHGRETASQVLRAGGIDADDAFGLRANQTAESGVIFTTNVPPGSRLRQRMLWSRLAAHIGCALRLRNHRVGAAPEGAAAVLTPTGRLEQASDAAVSAREDLATSAKYMDRARGKLRRLDPEEASSLWRAMVCGQWSLVDWIDHDGKRFILAQGNPVRRAPVLALTEREEQVAACAAMGHSNKLIAYDLGLSPSTVSVTLGRAAKKLGAANRVGLIRALREYQRGR